MKAQLSGKLGQTFELNVGIRAFLTPRPQHPRRRGDDGGCRGLSKAAKARSNFLTPPEVPHSPKAALTEPISAKLARKALSSRPNRRSLPTPRVFARSA